MLRQGILGILSPTVLREIQSPTKHTTCGVTAHACEDLPSINTCTVILDFAEVHLMGKQEEHAHCRGSFKLEWIIEENNCGSFTKAFTKTFKNS